MISTPKETQIRIASPQTWEEWDAYYHLRWRLLREPWGQPKGSEQDAFEAQAYHSAAFTQQGEIIGVGRVHIREPVIAQIRYMAVAEAYQCQGIGKLLLMDLETAVQTWAIHTIQLSARESAVGFYLKQGYRITGRGHILFDVIQHIQMEKGG